MNIGHFVLYLYCLHVQIYLFCITFANGQVAKNDYSHQFVAYSYEYCVYLIIFFRFCFPAAAILQDGTTRKNPFFFALHSICAIFAFWKHIINLQTPTRYNERSSSFRISFPVCHIVHHFMSQIRKDGGTHRGSIQTLGGSRRSRQQLISTCTHIG